MSAATTRARRRRPTKHREVGRPAYVVDDDDVTLDSPTYTPQAIIELRERGWERINMPERRLNQ